MYVCHFFVRWKENDVDLPHKSASSVFHLKQSFLCTCLSPSVFSCIVLPLS